MAARLKKGDNIIRCSGNLDTEAAAEAVRQDILARIQAGIPGLIIDLKEVNVLSSSGIQLLLAAANTLRALEQGLTLRNVSPAIETFFRRLNIYENFMIEAESAEEETI